MTRIPTGLVALGVAVGAMLAAGVAAVPAAAAGTCEVTSAADNSGAGTLRAAISSADAGGCSTVTFQSGLPTITLTSALPAITTSVTIDGTGSPVITSTGSGGVFSVTGGASVTFGDITVDGVSSSVDGGAISVNDSTASDIVTVANSTFDNDTGSTVSGGAIANDGASKVQIIASSFEHDSVAVGNGGALSNGAGGSLLVTQGSQFNADSAQNGGAIYNDASLQVANSTFQGDTASFSGGAIDNRSPNSPSSPAAGSTSDSVFIGNTAGMSGGAISNGDISGGAAPAAASMSVVGSEFSGNAVSAGMGGAFYDGAPDNLVESYVAQSTFVGDQVSGGPAAGDAIYLGEAVHAFDVTGNLFAEGCAGPGTLVSTGYNVAMPAASGALACAGAGAGDQVSDAAGDLGASPQNGQLLIPEQPNPAVDMIPGGTSVALGTGTYPLCPMVDLLGNNGPDASGHCDAGAVQAYLANSAAGGGGGGGGGGVGGTGPPPSAGRRTVTTVVRFYNQRITLVSPSMAVCAAAGGKLSATLGSTAIRHWRRPRLRFRLATFTVGGRDRLIVKRLPARESIRVRGLHAHATYRLRVVVHYLEPRPHRRARWVSRRLVVPSKVC